MQIPCSANYDNTSGRYIFTAINYRSIDMIIRAQKTLVKLSDLDL